MTSDGQPAAIPFEQTFGFKPPYLPSPLWRMPRGATLFDCRQGPSIRPIIVNSIPKSGTYLIAGTLENAGVINSGVHLRNTTFQDFRNASREAIISDPRLYLISSPASMTLDFIGKGQFAVGHLDYSPEIAAKLTGFTHLFLVRRTLDAMVSHLRFLTDPRRRHRVSHLDAESDPIDKFRTYLAKSAPSFLSNLRRQLGWLESGDVTVLRFEQLMGDFGTQARDELLDMVACRTGISGNDLKVAFGDTVGKATRTYSGARSSISSYVDVDSMADLIDELGVNSIDAQLGYPEQG